MERVLVAGGAGFIGSHLVCMLAERGIAVRVLDNLSSGCLANLQGVAPAIEFLHGDIRDVAACRDACRDVDVVFHLAALVSVPQSVADPVQAESINISGTLNLLAAARDCHVRRFVFSSSAAVYGDTDMIPTHEDVLPRPTSPYGVQKLAGEHYARIFHSLHGLKTVCLRYFNVYGPRQNPHTEYAAVVPKFLSRLVAGQAPTIYGDGRQTRDFCFVGDVVNANLLAAGTTNPEAIGGVFNIASGTRTSLNEMLALMREVTGAAVPARYEAARLGDVRHSGADIHHANSVLGYAPRTKAVDGLKETMRFCPAQATTDWETRKVAGSYVSDLWYLNAKLRK